MLKLTVAWDSAWPSVTVQTMLSVPEALALGMYFQVTEAEEATTVKENVEAAITEVPSASVTTPLAGTAVTVTVAVSTSTTPPVTRKAKSTGELAFMTTATSWLLTSGATLTLNDVLPQMLGPSPVLSPSPFTAWAQ